MVRPISAGTRPLLLGLLVLPLLAGCGGGEGYPSLARRSAELAGPDGKLVAPCATGQCQSKGKAQSAPCPPGPDSAPPARVTGSAAVVAPAPVVVPPAIAHGGDLSTRLAALVAGARAAHTRFLDMRVDAEARIHSAAGAAPGSDGWARANLALADLEAAHSATSSPLADLDRMTIDDRIDHADDDSRAPTERADAAAIRTATATVAGLADDEAAVLATLSAGLSH